MPVPWFGTQAVELGIAQPDNPHHALVDSLDVGDAVRGMAKSTGHRLPASLRLTFARKATEACPEALQPALLPLLRLVQTLTDDIAAYDRLVVEKARAYPETEAVVATSFPNDLYPCPTSGGNPARCRCCRTDFR